MTSPTENRNEMGSEYLEETGTWFNYDNYNKILNNRIKMEDTPTKLDQL